MKRAVARTLRAAFVVAVIVGLILFGRTIEWRQTWQALRSTSPALLAVAALVNLLSLALKGVRWWIFLRPVGVTSLWLAIRATFTGAALNNVLIANSGEAARVLLVSRAAHVPSAGVLASLALERLFELVGYVLMLAISASLLPLPHAISDMRPFAFAALVLTLVLLMYLLRHPEKVDMPLLEGETFLHRARHYGRRFARTIGSISTTGRFGVSLAISVGVWALQVVTYALTARAARFPVPLVATVAAILAVNLGFAVRTTPGNVGVFQMIYAVTVAAFGLDKDQAIAVALLIQAQQIIPVTVIGLLAAPRFVLDKGASTAEST